jgi:eukaryotic-like serine/threonine-protein kinase
MANADAITLANHMMKIGLVAEGQLQEAWDELGQRGGEPEPLLRILERKGYLTPYQSKKLLAGDIDGYVLGGYRILYKIASGSFGRVYRAEDPQTGRVVAIKVLRRRWSEDDHTIGLFEREGQVGLQLRHPNIVEVLAVSQDPITKQYFIVMEFVEGGNLRDFLAIRGKLDTAEALRITEECASAIAYASSKGVTHRDLKLTNVLIASQGIAKLVDFGLAGIFTRKGLELEGGEKVDRTVDYAGLEKRTGVKSGDVRSDIFFLGCITYEMLTCRSPLLMTKDPRVRMSPGRFDNISPMRKQETDAPPPVFQLVERMMSLDPRLRYQTPSQLLDAIREVRRDLEGGGAAGSGSDNKAPYRSIFIVERDQRLQDAMREHFKKLGFRVFVAADPARALDRFLLQPYDGLVVDAETTGEEGRYTFEQIVKEASRNQVDLGAILILAQEQASWAEQIPTSSRAVVLVKPLTLRQLHRRVEDLVPLPAGKLV